MTELFGDCDCSQFPGRLYDLCTGQGHDGRPDPPAEAVARWRETMCGPRTSAQEVAPVRSRSRRNPSISHGIWSQAGVSLPKPDSVAVVVLSHNYGRYLAECLQSVLAQTHRPQEILVIDDASTDNTPDIAAAFAAEGVKYERVEHRNVHRGRATGFEKTRSQIVCFLDADDVLSPTYLADGIAGFTEANVGLVYSDVEFFEAEQGRTSYPEVFSRDLFLQDNYLHAGSLVLREALLQSRAFEKEIDPLTTQGDWFLWRQVLRNGWAARKQPAVYRYRKHQSNWTLSMREANRGYFEYADLAFETVTLLIPLSGRTSLWPALSAFLQRQTWPHQQIQLILCDTSGNPEFSAAIRAWAAQSDYADVRVLAFSPARSGLADENRRRESVQQDVRLAMARLYGHLSQQATTDFVWILEDDILPPEDVCEQLLRGFDAETGSVSALYHSRFDRRPCVWDSHWQHYEHDGTGLGLVHGNGFGCVVLREALLRKSAFKSTGDFDRLFYREVAAAGWKVKVRWDLTCEHRSVERQTLTETGCVCAEAGWCERHVCDKTEHWHRLCQTRKDYFALWEGGRGPGQFVFPDAEPTEPGLLRKAMNFGSAVVRHAADLGRNVDADVFEQRLAVCRSCPSCDQQRMVCREKQCGCQLHMKARWRSESCPLGKWQSSDL